MRGLSISVFVVLGLFLPACGGSDSSEQIHGEWEWPPWPVYGSMEDDGSFVVSESPDLSDPFEWGTYTFDGETFTLNNAQDSPSCPSTSVTWTVEFADDGNEAALTFVEDSCFGSARGTSTVLIRMST